MRRLLGAAIVAALVFGPGSPARTAGGKEGARDILDRAIKAMGGEQKLSAFKAATWKAKGKISFGGSDNDFTSQGTVQGLDHSRSDFEGEFMGNKIKGSTVVAGDKGWRKIGDMEMELDKDALANEKRSLYLLVSATNPLVLRGNGFKVKAAGEEKVDGKAAVALQVTAPDGKDFRLYIDKASGLPVKQVAKVVGFMGEDFTRETTFGKYKDFDGVKKATHVVSKRDGEPFIDEQVTEFRVLPRVDPKTFTKPE
jgi:hypothetical protein